MEGELADLNTIHADGIYLLRRKYTAVEYEQQFVSLVGVGCPIDCQQLANGQMGAEFFGDFPAQSMDRALAWLQIAARDIPKILVGGVDQHHAADLVEIQNSGSGTRPGEFLVGTCISFLAGTCISHEANSTGSAGSWQVPGKCYAPGPWEPRLTNAEYGVSDRWPAAIWPCGGPLRPRPSSPW
jgi:hypothetical protein